MNIKCKIFNYQGEKLYEGSKVKIFKNFTFYPVIKLKV